MPLGQTCFVYLLSRSAPRMHTYRSSRRKEWPRVIPAKSTCISSSKHSVGYRRAVTFCSLYGRTPTHSQGCWHTLQVRSLYFHTSPCTPSGYVNYLLEVEKLILLVLLDFNSTTIDFNVALLTLILLLDL